MAKACYQTGCLRMAIRGEARCEEHHRPIAGHRARQHAARRAGRDGDGAARRLRNRVNKSGFYPCDSCGGVFRASGLDIDHIVPLGNGGTDFDWYVQALCTGGCHASKTIAENRNTTTTRRAPTIAERRRR